MVEFKNIDSAKYYLQYKGKILRKNDVPDDVFEDLVNYDKAFFNTKGIHVFKSIENR